MTSESEYYNPKNSNIYFGGVQTSLINLNVGCNTADSTTLHFCNAISFGVWQR